LRNGCGFGCLQTELPEQGAGGFADGLELLNDGASLIEPCRGLRLRGAENLLQIAREVAGALPDTCQVATTPLRVPAC
jgi:hypothetical protein